jgi:hypothetical protein
VAVDEDGRNAFFLGDVSDKHICSPNLEHMLQMLSVYEEEQKQKQEDVMEVDA